MEWIKRRGDDDDATAAAKRRWEKTGFAWLKRGKMDPRVTWLKRGKMNFRVDGMTPSNRRKNDHDERLSVRQRDTTNSWIHARTGLHKKDRVRRNQSGKRIKTDIKF